MNWYTLTRNRYNFKFDNPDKVRAIHSDLYFFIVDRRNRLWQKEKFWLPTQMTMELLGIWSYNTYQKTYSDLFEWWFIREVQKSKNQYSSRVIALSKNDKATDEALDKALDETPDETSDETSDESPDDIIEQLNKRTKEEKKKYAPKVFMTETQYSNSCAKWTKPVVDEYIESISYYITNVKPKKKYKSIPKTITDWIKRDQQSGKRLAKLKSIYGDPLEVYSKFKKEVEDMENEEIHEYYKKNMMTKYHEDFLREAKHLYSKKQNA